MEGNAIVTKNTISISGFPYSVTISDHHLRIWLEQHTFDEWRMFDDKDILKLDGPKGLQFWNRYKEILLVLCNDKETE